LQEFPLAQHVYEGMFILDSNRYARDASGTVATIPTTVEQFGGQILASRLWEERRIEAEVEVADMAAESPGSFLYLEAEFEEGRAAFGWLGEKGLRPEVAGDRAARRMLRFLEDEEASAVDAHLADQLVVPLCLSGGGGRITTSEVTAHLETVAQVATLFGFTVTVTGRAGTPGQIEVARC
jgi:RNA 3'-terminal phosphate cyclase (ATP)